MLQSLLAEVAQYHPGERLLVINSAANDCVPLLARQAGAGEVVLVEDSVAASALARQALQALGPACPRFRAVPFHTYTASEPPATADVVVMNLSYQSSNAWRLYGVQLAAYALKPGGRLYIEGEKDRGVLSLGKRAREIFGNLETLKIAKGWRVLCATKRAQSSTVFPAPDMAAFAGGRMDEGTSLLLEALEVRVSDVALDLGCGSGFIGAHIAGHAHKGQVTLVDTSLVSVDAARALLEERGLSNARVLASDGIQEVSGQRFSLVATNPPFHVGGLQTTAIAERFIREAARVLLPRGRFYLVANRFLKYEPVLNACFGEVVEVAGNPRFKVLRAAGRPVPIVEGEEILEQYEG